MHLFVSACRKEICYIFEIRDSIRGEQPWIQQIIEVTLAIAMPSLGLGVLRVVTCPSQRGFQHFQHSARSCHSLLRTAKSRLGGAKPCVRTARVRPVVREWRQGTELAASKDTRHSTNVPPIPIIISTKDEYIRYIALEHTSSVQQCMREWMGRLYSPKCDL